MSELARLLARYRRASTQYDAVERALDTADAGSAEYGRLDRKANRLLWTMKEIGEEATPIIPGSYADLALKAELLELYSPALSDMATDDAPDIQLALSIARDAVRLAATA
jgi:hypothetical protein